MAKNSNSTISIGQLSNAVARALNRYADDIADGTDKAARRAAVSCRKDIAERASALFKQHTGDRTYAKQWTYKQTGKARGRAEYVVYCRKPGLTHLLENGHASVNGGRAEGRAHIAPAAEKAAAEFAAAVEEVIRNAGG